MALFVQRARAVRRTSALTDGERRRRWPSSAAGWTGSRWPSSWPRPAVKLLPPPALLARLGGRLALLTGGRRDAPARQQTMRATLDWSYDLLAADRSRRCFARLAVFAGGCTLEAGGGASAPPGPHTRGFPGEATSRVAAWAGPAPE